MKMATACANFENCRDKLLTLSCWAGVLHLARGTHLINDNSERKGLSMWTGQECNWLGSYLNAHLKSNRKSLTVNYTLANAWTRTHSYRYYHYGILNAWVLYAGQSEFWWAVLMQLWIPRKILVLRIQTWPLTEREGLRRRREQERHRRASETAE